MCDNNQNYFKITIIGNIDSDKPECYYKIKEYVMEEEPSGETISEESDERSEISEENEVMSSSDEHSEISEDERNEISEDEPSSISSIEEEEHEMEIDNIKKSNDLFQNKYLVKSKFHNDLLKVPK